MADDRDLELYETKAALAEIREEMTEIRNQNNELKRKLIVDNLTKTGEIFERISRPSFTLVDDFQTNISTEFRTIEGTLNAWAARGNTL